MKRAAIYARVSTEEQGERDKSIPEQIAECEALCERRGFEIIARYIDDTPYRDAKGKLQQPSGMRKDRPAYQQMIRDAKNGQFDVIVAWSEDRLYRCPRAVYPLSDIIGDRGKRKEPLAIVLVTGGIDPRTMNLMASIYEMNVRDMQERMMRGKRGNAKAGKLEGGGLPYGYRYHGGNLVIYQEEAAIIREIYRRYVSGIGVPDIVRWLNAEAIPTKRRSKKGWQQSAVYAILRHPRYKGVRYFDGIEIPCPAIVDEELWEQARRVRKQNKIHNKRNTKEIYPLRGILYCDECGRRMAVHRKTNKHSPPTRSYRCMSHYRYAGLRDSCKALNYVSAEKLEAAVWKRLEGFVRSPTWLWALTESNYEQLEDNRIRAEERMKSVARKLERLGEERQRVITWARGEEPVISEKDLALQLLDIQSQKEVCRDEYSHALQMKEMAETSMDKLQYAISVCEGWTQIVAAAGPDPLPALEQEFVNYNQDNIVGEMMSSIAEMVGFINPENWPQKKLELQQQIFQEFLNRVCLDARGRLGIQGHIRVEDLENDAGELSELDIPELPIYRSYADVPRDKVKEAPDQIIAPFNSEAPWS